MIFGQKWETSFAQQWSLIAFGVKTSSGQQGNEADQCEKRRKEQVAMKPRVCEGTARQIHA